MRFSRTGLFSNTHSRRRTSLQSLILEACTARFRPFLLAFLTTFAGFLPTLLETSEQAQFLIPMTLSLSAGLLFGMAASLVLTPVCYAIFHDKFGVPAGEAAENAAAS